MLDLNRIRKEFADFLSADPTRFRMDAALAHVVTIAYQQGINDGGHGNTSSSDHFRDPAKMIEEN